jgi:uncharacterized protein
MNKTFLLLVFVLIIFVSAQEITTYVNDYAGLLNENEKLQISSIAEEIFNSGNAQYSVLIVNTTNGKNIQEYGLETAQGKLGDTEKQNGLLLIVAVSDRQYFFEVGSGLEGTLNDAKVGRIGRDYLVPNFRNNEYGKGITEASNALKSILVNGTELTTASSASKELTQGQINFIIVFSIFFILMIVLSIRRELKRKNKHFDAAEGAIVIFGGGKGGFGGGGFGGFGGGGFSGGGGGGGW